MYHAGEDPADQGRERALARCGVELTLVVPRGGCAPEPGDDSFRVVRLPVRRHGDVNRHTYEKLGELADVIADVRPDILDVHQEPFSSAARQWLRVSPRAVPVVMYTAQNIDKRYPPPFAQYEAHALSRVRALYPCSAQAASVARGKGYGGIVRIIPLGHDPALYRPGSQSLEDEVVLAFVGRLVSEKGAEDAVRVLKRVRELRPARLVVAGSGPNEERVRSVAARLAVSEYVELRPWQSASDLADLLRSTHAVLVPSIASRTWAEQYGRIIAEAQACGCVVAAYATGSIPEVAGDAGLLAPVGDARRLAELVVALLDNRAEYACRRRQGVESSLARSWMSVAEAQVNVYELALASQAQPYRPRQTPRDQRTAARIEFGPTAATPAGMRPFALPVLRSCRPLAVVVGALIDAAATIGVQVKARRGR